MDGVVALRCCILLVHTRPGTFTVTPARAPSCTHPAASHRRADAVCHLRAHAVQRREVAQESLPRRRAAAAAAHRAVQLHLRACDARHADGRAR